MEELRNCSWFSVHSAIWWVISVDETPARSRHGWWV